MTDPAKVAPPRARTPRNRLPLSQGQGQADPKPRPATKTRQPVELPSRGPHLDELTRELRAHMAAVLIRPSGRAVRLKMLAAAVGALVVASACSGFYDVEADQTAIVTRFGVVSGQSGPGLHYHLPAPIEAVRTLSTAGVNRLQIGALDPVAGSGAGRRLLTRDGKLVDVTASVQWRIIDPLRYVLQTAEQEASLRMTAEAALSEAIAQAPLGDVLGPARQRVGSQVATLLRRSLSREDMGVEIVDVQVGEARPPEGAEAGFHAIASANVDVQAGLNGAEAYRSHVVAEARGDAAKMVQTSQGYRDQEVSEAKGEAERFALIDAQYRKAPDVTRERLYSETMERVLHNVRKVIVQAPKDGSGQIVLPAEAFRSKGAEATSGQAVQAQPAQGAAQPSGAAAAQSQAAQPDDPASKTSSTGAAPAGAVQAGGGIAG